MFNAPYKNELIIIIKYPYKGIIMILILLQCISQVDIPTQN